MSHHLNVSQHAVFQVMSLDMICANLKIFKMWKHARYVYIYILYKTLPAQIPDGGDTGHLVSKQL
jgi:hypothetical protein